MPICLGNKNVKRFMKFKRVTNKRAYSYFCFQILLLFSGVRLQQLHKNGCIIVADVCFLLLSWRTM
jgi:intergrase/recombinase